MSGNEVKIIHPLNVVIEEHFLQSKTGKLNDCEDAIHIGQNFIAVIDGATSKVTRSWEGKTSGQRAAHLITQALQQMPADYTAHQAVQFITQLINDYYIEQNALNLVKNDPAQRITASFAAVSLARREVWLVGDCKARLGERLITKEKTIDRITSEARSVYLAIEILKGKTIQQLRQHDTGRDFIMPLLLGQANFQNNPCAGDYSYSVIDGFPILLKDVMVYHINENIDTIILTTDGYPSIEDNLAKSEGVLQDILHQDPLLIYDHKSTKGLVEGNVSFDDRAFIKLKIVKNSGMVQK